MNPVPFAKRRPFTTLLLVIAPLVVVALASVDILGSPKQREGIDLALKTPDGESTHSYLDSVGTRAGQAKDYIVEWCSSLFHKHEAHHIEPPAIVVTSPKTMDVTITKQYVCQIRSRQHIDVRALEMGYLEEIPIREGQAVKKGDVLFTVLTNIYQAKLDAENAEARLAEIEFINTQKLKDYVKPIVSEQEVLLAKAKLAKARAKADQAKAELDFTRVVAPFDGIVDRQLHQRGSLVQEGEILTTLSDNAVMWVYFNVPEKAYLEYMAMSKEERENQKIELELANHDMFSQPCINMTVEGIFNNQTGNIKFRADFPNPDGVLRHGQTGTILIKRTLKDAIIIPQRATFELLDKRYVWVVGEDNVAHQKEITIRRELEDVFVLESGIEASDKIVFEGVREVQEGGEVEYEFRKPEEVLKNQKFHAE